MLEFIASAAGGGLFGLVGSLGKKAIGYFETKQRNGHDLEVMRIGQETLKIEIAAQEKLAKLDYEKETTISDNKALTAAIDAEAGIRSSTWVSNVRGLVRPVLTASLLIITTSIWYFTDDLELEKKLAMELVFMTSAAVLFWFGDRPSERRSAG